MLLVLLVIFILVAIVLFRGQRTPPSITVVHGGRKGFRPDISSKIEFKSSWEANYARFLTQICRGVKWEYEPKRFLFPIEVTRRFGLSIYTPDFAISYKNNDISHYIEIKGCKNIQSLPAVAKQKAFLLKKYYPRIKLYFVTGEEYKIIERLYAHRIENWEY